FAYGCNSYNEMTVASGFDVDLFAASREGDVLTAVAEEVHQAGRTGVYDIRVTNQRGERIAVFRGRSYRMKGRPTVAPQAAG
ncbi:MAG TPA: hotdog fold thioesterase, partial [Burkholderiaceae bacterium]|nr:hotdog fold thioesterase [Burkholderiaceae bacterium]